jgi:hypothetical protein
LLGLRAHSSLFQFVKDLHQSGAFYLNLS